MPVLAHFRRCKPGINSKQSLLKKSGGQTFTMLMYELTALLRFICTSSHACSRNLTLSKHFLHDRLKSDTSAFTLLHLARITIHWIQ